MNSRLCSCIREAGVTEPCLEAFAPVCLVLSCRPAGSLILSPQRCIRHKDVSLWSFCKTAALMMRSRSEEGKAGLWWDVQPAGFQKILFSIVTPRDFVLKTRSVSTYAICGPCLHFLVYRTVHDAHSCFSSSSILLMLNTLYSSSVELDPNAEATVHRDKVYFREVRLNRWDCRWSGKHRESAVRNKIGSVRY